MTDEGTATYLRRAQPLNDPLPATLRWMTKLPEETRPLALVQQYPRIANLLARTWSDGEDFLAYLESLLVDRRGGRRGFPPDVHNELLTLREFAVGRYPAEAALGNSGGSDEISTSEHVDTDSAFVPGAVAVGALQGT